MVAACLPAVAAAAGTAVPVLPVLLPARLPAVCGCGRMGVVAVCGLCGRPLWCGCITGCNTQCIMRCNTPTVPRCGTQKAASAARRLPATAIQPLLGDGADFHRLPFFAGLCRSVLFHPDNRHPDNRHPDNRNPDNRNQLKQYPSRQYRLRR